MRISLTLDYELFFGKRTGTPQACMIDASNRLLEILDEFAAPAVFFVDASYLVRLREYRAQSIQLAREYEAIVEHIRGLEACGHQIQLHIHPHWFDSFHDGQRWNMVTDRYRLAQWTDDKIAQLISRCTTELNGHLRNKVFAFRAGGWCIQPFPAIADALQANGIRVDSSVFYGGRGTSGAHQFDFRTAPPLASWRFGSDPCQADAAGAFTELPISALRVSPIFYWRFALSRLFGSRQCHARFGDGVPIENERRALLQLLTRPSYMAVSVDGYKATLLRSAFRQARHRGRSHFVAMGHPKSLTPHSLQHLRTWLCDVYESGAQLEGYSIPVQVPRVPEVVTG
ncbi:hypothetical protein [Microbulbifer aggregans]|uniref:hypothetical protein n=1 Tax=Microbulbifer aggregans TaxID=1769779 RepID=UPI001CFE6DC6|nr:hypothetical protein [Microbulbifer aggregans]